MPTWRSSSAPVSLPLRDIALVIVGTVLMALAVRPLSGLLRPLPELILQGLVGFCVYGGLMLAFDVARSRTLLRLWLASRRGRRGAEPS